MFDITFAQQSFEKLVYGLDLFLRENLKIVVLDQHKLGLTNHGFCSTTFLLKLKKKFRFL